MPQHDYSIANQSGAGFRADLNTALSAIVSQNSGNSEPVPAFAYMPWADTLNGLMKIRNSGNTDWIELYRLDGQFKDIKLQNGTALAPSLYFSTSGTDTGLFSGGADQVNIATGGIERVEWGTSEVVFNDSGENYDFRIEGDTQPQLFLVDASEDKVKITGGFKVINSGATAGVGAVIETENLATSLVNGDVLGQWDMISNDNSTNANGSRVRIKGSVVNDTGNSVLEIQTKGSGQTAFSTRLTANSSGVSIQSLTASTVYGSFAMIENINDAKMLSASAVLYSTDAQSDFNISQFLIADVRYTHYMYIEVTGLYTSGGVTPTTVNRLHKVWSQHVFWTGSAWSFANGATLHGSYNSDATNFPAGTVNASKVLTVAVGTDLFIRCQNRTSPVVGSTATFKILVRIAEVVANS